MFDFEDETEEHNCTTCEHVDECDHPGKESYMLASFLRTAASAVPEDHQKRPLVQLLNDAAAQLVEIQQQLDAVEHLGYISETNNELINLVGLYYSVNPPMIPSERVRVDLSRIFAWYRNRVETESAPIDLEEDE